MSDPLLDEDRLGAWLDAIGVNAGASLASERMTGGRSNVMYRVDRGEDRLVLRRPAAVANDRANDGMSREFTVLSALQHSAVPVPVPIAICEDPEVLGCTFYLMSRVEGFSPTDIPPDLAASPTIRSDITDAATDALAAINSFDWRSGGLADFGRPDDFHARQVQRWTSQFDSYRGRPIEAVATVGNWLGGHLPTTWTPGLMHADYHMLNLLIRHDDPRKVAAVVDWETATIGDPLLDLAGFCELWTGAFSDNGWPPRAAIVQRYCDQRGLQSIPDLRYYEVLHNFRLGVLLEGIYQRSRRDETRGPDEDSAQRAMRHLERAEALTLAGASDSSRTRR